MILSPTISPLYPNLKLITKVTAGTTRTQVVTSNIVTLQNTSGKLTLVLTSASGYEDNDIVRVENINNLPNPSYSKITITGTSLILLDITYDSSYTLTGGSKVTKSNRNVQMEVLVYISNQLCGDVYMPPVNNQIEIDITPMLRVNNSGVIKKPLSVTIKERYDDANGDLMYGSSHTLSTFFFKTYFTGPAGWLQDADSYYVGHGEEYLLHLIVNGNYKIRRKAKTKIGGTVITDESFVASPYTIAQYVASVASNEEVVTYTILGADDEPISTPIKFFRLNEPHDADITYIGQNGGYEIIWVRKIDEEIVAEGYTVTNNYLPENYRSYRKKIKITGKISDPKMLTTLMVAKQIEFRGEIYTPEDKNIRIYKDVLYVELTLLSQDYVALY